MIKLRLLSILSGTIFLAGLGAFACTAPLFASSRAPGSILPQLLPTDLAVLPEHAIDETVLTTVPEVVDVTVARLPRSALIGSIFTMPRSPELFDAAAIPIEHLSTGEQLEHHIHIGGLPIGLYEVKLVTHDRTIIQKMNVGTLGILTNLSPTRSVLFAIDLRTLRKRKDVRAQFYDSKNTKTLFPGENGLIHFPYQWMGRTDVAWPSGLLVATASDGSVAIIYEGWSMTEGTHTYTETDRKIYQPGDRVYYRFITRQPNEPNKVFLVVEGSKGYTYAKIVRPHGRITSGNFVLPASVPAGFYNFDGIFVARPDQTRYEISVATLTPVVRPGTFARFIVSAQLLDVGL